MVTKIFPFLISCFFGAFVIAQPKLVTNLDKKLKESSGLAFTKHGLWTVNDGKSNSIYRIDEQSGIIRQEIILTNTTFIDAEGIACDQHYLYIEDAGNNDGQRKDLKIVRLAIDSIHPTEKTQSLTAETISFIYPEQTNFNPDKKNNNFDCESIIATKDSLFLFTKRRGDNQTSLYALPKKPGNYKAVLKKTFNVSGLITDAAISDDERSVVLVGYLKGHVKSFMWVFTNFRGYNFFDGSNKYVLLNQTEDTWQTEGICFAKHSKLFISCETTQDHPAGLYVIVP